MELNETTVNAKFDAYLTAFKLLAEKEDELDLLKAEVNDYKEGTPKHQAAIQKVMDFEKGMVIFQRELRFAAIELDRVKTLISVRTI
jgi:outer membrane PBP1 activator LpoA protein